jgi:threonine synthase
MADCYELRCRECGKTWDNAPLSFCDDCFASLEVSFDYDRLKKTARRENLSSRPFNMWRYKEFLPLAEDFTPPNAVGGTPLIRARHLAKRWGVENLYVKNDAVCFPTLSFKDRVVAVALAAARRFEFQTVGCSSTGNLANAVAAQAAQQGFDACVFIPADLEPAKVLNTAVYGARIVRIQGNYDHVNRLCGQIADRFRWGLVNVNLRPYYAEGSKTHGFEIAEQLGWRLPDNVVVPMAGGSLIGKIAKAFRELVTLGWVEEKPVKFFGAQATGCSPISDGVKRNLTRFEPQKPQTIARSLAIGNPADGPYALKLIRATGGWAEDVSDPEIIAAIKELAETEGVFAETAGGVTAGVTQKLIAQGRIQREEMTVVCVTGNGLKTTDALMAEYPLSEPIPPRLEAFEALLDQQLAVASVVLKGA